MVVEELGGALKLDKPFLQVIPGSFPLQRRQISTTHPAYQLKNSRNRSTRVRQTDYILTFEVVFSTDSRQIVDR